MILLIDNYDSFVYNLARYLREMGCETHVARNDALSLDEIERMEPRAIVVSPGPCAPSRAGISEELVRVFADRIPMLGVCLGHQAIGEALGGAVARSPVPVHGMRCRVHHDGTGLFAESLRVTARSDDGLVMAIAHATRPLFGVQFHPESVLTESGHRLLSNFLTLAGVSHTIPAVGDYQERAEPANHSTQLQTTTPITW
jgi:anthranilate/para-aminobenzoate synthase component II